MNNQPAETTTARTAVFTQTRMTAQISQIRTLEDGTLGSYSVDCRYRAQRRFGVPPSREFQHARCPAGSPSASVVSAACEPARARGWG